MTANLRLFNPVPRPSGGWEEFRSCFLVIRFAVLSLRPRLHSNRVCESFNAVGNQACVAVPVPELLRSWYGEEADNVDFSHYERRGHEKDSVYDITQIREELGFVPQMPILGD